MKLEGKVALVTGAGLGMGRATAKLFSDEGAKVIINDVSQENLEETLNLLSDIFLGSDNGVVAILTLINSNQ